jgi:hypothetical protein|tara:strand:+ start:1541 stop:1753 length:213 start_codon:yes stop_codon:yes gene_type:complete
MIELHIPCKVLEWLYTRQIRGEIMKKYYATVSEDVLVRANSKDEAIVKIRNKYQSTSVNLDIEIFDEVEI